MRCKLNSKGMSVALDSPWLQLEEETTTTFMGKWRLSAAHGAADQTPTIPYCLDPQNNAN